MCSCGWCVKEYNKEEEETAGAFMRAAVLSLCRCD